MTISICIATYRRPARLAALLDDLALQERLPDEVVVVDNDAEASARAVVARRRQLGVPFALLYDVQPQKNISLTRNRTVERASGDWVAFVDDDERAPVSWLRQLADAAARYRADGVLGPVVPIVPDEAPAWIRKGGFYGWERMRTGAVVPSNRLRFGNVLLRGALLRRTSAPFDAEYGLTGGEDGDLLLRLVQGGARVIWCDEATVTEPVEPMRLSLRWLVFRSLRGGQDFARHRRAGRYGRLGVAGKAALVLRALLQASVAAVLAVLLLPRGRHRSAYWLMKAAANLGKVTIFIGWHYREYGP